MKKIKIYLKFAIVMMLGFNSMHCDELAESIVAYNNHVLKAGFSAGSDGISAVVLQFQEKPICYYAPSSYLESLDENVKHFILPRTTWTDRNLSNFMNDLEFLLQPLDIQFECSLLSGNQFGLQITFRMDSLKYEIKKIVNRDNKVVCFEIKLKK